MTSATCFAPPPTQLQDMSTSLERNNYFPGRLLGTEDHEREQLYGLSRLRNHNRYAHGWGVLCGLQVVMEGAEVVVKPGVAIDCEGNELHVSKELRAAVPSTLAPFYVGIKYLEVFSSPTPGPDGLLFSVVADSVEVEVSLTNAALGHSKLGPGSCGCGQRHALVLASARQHKGSWQLRRAKSGG
jgi:hypothetical protein